MGHIEQRSSATLNVTQLGGRVGAEIKDIQLSSGLSPEIVRAIQEAMLHHKVIFFRDQKGPDSDIEGFADLFADPLPHPISAAPGGNRYAYEMDYSTEFRSDHWHTDFSFQEKFVDGGILYPVTVANVGGETVWSNTVAAYEELPPPLKAMADGLWAVHSSTIPWALTFPNPTPAELKLHRDYNAKVGQSTRHPVVRVHPETGERALLLGNFVQYFEGFARSATNHIYELFHYYVMRPENTIRWHWRYGDVAIWDNRTTQHYGVRDYGKSPRVMRRISFGMSSPVAIDGTRSSVVG